MADEALWTGSMPAEYEAGLGDALFRPCARSTAQRVAGLLPEGGQVLELAAGTGLVTAELVALRGVTVVATDVNAAMVEHGRPRVPEASWLQADALALPAGESTFDAVVCQFGVMFFPDRVRALAEVRRVLRPGGAAVVTSWGAVEHNDVTAALVDALDEVLPEDPPTFPVRVPHGYADPVRLTAYLEKAGLRDTQVRAVELTGTGPSAAAVARGFVAGTPLGAELAARGDVDALLAALADAMARRLGEGPVTGRLRFLEAVGGR